MDRHAIDRSTERLAGPKEAEPKPADLDAVLERAREGVEALAARAAELEAAMPEKLGAAVRESIGSEARPVARQLAEVRGLMNQVLRRLERLEDDVRGERHARIDDLGVLVDLITTGWQSVDERLARLERQLSSGEGAVVYRIEERRADEARAK